MVRMTIPLISLLLIVPLSCKESSSNNASSRIISATSHDSQDEHVRERDSEQYVMAMPPKSTLFPNMSAEEVRARSRQLSKQLQIPLGATMEEVEAIFGKHTCTKKRAGYRRPRHDACFHYYDLQSVHLTIEYVEGRVAWRFWEMGWENNRTDYGFKTGSENEKRVRMELENEDRYVLKNLEEACRKYKTLNESKGYIP